MLNVDNLLDYLEFVAERHRVWERRQQGTPGPWTSHQILRERKFTNVYRVLDWGSQFLVQELLDPELDPRDVLARCFLYRHTNRPEAWHHIREEWGAYPLAKSMGNGLVKAWRRYRDDGHQVFSGAYMIYPQSSVKGTDKIEQVVDLTNRLFHPDSPDDIVPSFLGAESQGERFHVLRSVKGVADFMAMQILTDWGYSSQCGEDRENEFVVLGPGARRGALALDPDRNPYTTFTTVRCILWRSREACPSLTLVPGGRRPSYMDVQNTLCEFSKWVRYRDKDVSPDKPYQPAHPGYQHIQLPTSWLTH